MIKNFTLIQKVQLTYNIFELIFEWKDDIDMIPGQFITFLLDNIWWRAYSILEAKWKNITLIIKKRELSDWWRWWSKFICELGVWDVLKWVWPAWKFFLQKNNKNKLFLGTGTWVVPLYNQIIWSIEQRQDCKLKLIFWIRASKDLFYIDKFEKLKQRYPNFDFVIYLSSEKIDLCEKWYVTEFLIPKNTKSFEEFYICWIPAMIDSSVKMLKNLWISEKNMFLEKY